MKTSKIVAFASVIAVTALLLGAVAFLPTTANDAANSSDATAPEAHASLEPIVVVATR